MPPLQCPHCLNDNRLLIEICARLAERVLYQCEVCNKKWEILKGGVINKVGT